MSNPWIVEPETVKLEVAVPGVGAAWLMVRRTLSIGEQRKMMRNVSTVSQPVQSREELAASKAAGTTVRAEAKYEWTEYSFARMVAYVVDWSLAHDPLEANRLPPTRDSYEKLRDFVFEAFDDALDAHEQAANAEKKAMAGAASPSATS